MDEEEQQQPLETQESQEEPKPKRTAKKRRRPKQALRITKKAMAKFDKTVLKEYKKYVNAIRRRKSCRIMSFEAFGKKHMSKSKKSKRKGKGKGKAAVEAEAAPLDETEVAEETKVDESAEESPPVAEETPPVAAEEMPVSEEPPVAAEEMPVSEETNSAEESLEGSASAPEETKPPSAATGIAQSVSDAAKSVTDSLGLSSTAEKKGGKKKRGSKRRGSKRL